MKLRKIFIIAILLAVGIAMLPQPAAAQSSGAFTSLTPLFSPVATTITTTCTTTGCPTFIFSGMCTGTIRVTGATTINVVVKVSNDGGANYSQITPLVVGVAANGTVTTNAIAANGLYSVTLATMNRVRFEVGTLTGASATFKFVASSGCISQAL
jgi:hypothetical protein